MMPRLSRALAVLIGLTIAGIIGLQAHQSAAPGSEPLDRRVLDQYCVTCHNERLRTAGLMLDSVDLAQTGANARVLERVVHKLRSGQMPPQGRPRPDKPTVDAFATALETALDHAAAASPNPGRIAAHRLNRLEYVNAVHDLLSLDIDPALLPADNPGVGFDNNADILSVTPGLMNRYMSAASKVSRLAIGDPGIRPTIQVYRVPEFAYQDARMSEDLPFGTHGGLAVEHVFPLDGEYAFRLRLQRNTIGDTIRGIDDEHEIQVRIDHALVKRFTVGGQYKGFDPGFVNSAPADDVEGQKLHTYRLTADEALEFRIPLKAGPRLVTAAFTDTAPAVSERVPLVASSPKRWIFTDDAGAPGIDTIEISGPYAAAAPDDTPSRRRILVCRPKTAHDAEPCARTILSTLARRAYRRPVSDADVRELMRLYRTGSQEGGFASGIGLALETLLWSPAFLIRMEHDPAGVLPGSVHRVSDLELASRLSFFLWRSIPDDELLDVAARGRLNDPTVLPQQVRRMLADPKATRWMNDFIGQWLTVRNIQGHEPDPDVFPEFDDNLRQAMETETELLFQSQVREDQGLLELLRADYTFLNQRLAQHYGVPGVYGSHFRRVGVSDLARRGLLGQASILTVTSYANRTSVVLRGKWVLDTLLGAPPPPPPANVPPLQDNQPGAAPKSLRERMEQHRKNPVCASCHAPMDPFGFVLENFDATGRWRETDAGASIDRVSAGMRGETIDGPAGLRTYLLSRSDEFVQTVTRKLLEYALGRSLEYYDGPAVRQLVRDAAPGDYRWSSLILGIVKSTPFQMRRVASPEETAGTSAVQARR
jgi:hypothetical protein